MPYEHLKLVQCTGAKSWNYKNQTFPSSYMYVIVINNYNVIKINVSFFSVELRELEAKLKSGYMNRERAAQLAEKFAMELDRKVRNYGVATKKSINLPL